ncbi:MAG: xanthine dehydrogenase accessory protein XdhC [Rhizobiales bacterium]|nr:xanthine dehydrogenase accessory protein XdhC [Hyphomicrobiales bacterium]
MKLSARARALLANGTPVALVRVAQVQGSAPREEGAAMLVTADGIAGSIGGGTLEWKAMAEAQRLLRAGGERSVMRYALGPDLGQCCGGTVEIITEKASERVLAELEGDEAPGRTLYLFGAGHVGRALVLVLAQTGFRIVWCDPRPGAFPAAVPGNVTLRDDADAPAILREAPAGSLLLIMSHSHALDLAVTDAGLRNPAVAATGLIGSASKRIRFERRLRAAGVADDRIAALICPIGIGGIRSKRPEAIAISTAAQLVALDESLKLREASPAMSQQTGRAAS